MYVSIVTPRLWLFLLLQYNYMHADLQPLDTVLTPDEVCIATSIWPITKRQHGSGKKKLNKGQRSTISIAMNNDFTLIQGPPGINNYTYLQ